MEFSMKIRERFVPGDLVFLEEWRGGRGPQRPGMIISIDGSSKRYTIATVLWIDLEISDEVTLLALSPLWDAS